jgi:hypothetical protein
MAWTKSAVFRSWLECALGPLAGWGGGWNRAGGINSVNDWRCSLWKDTITPDETADVVDSGFAVPGSPWHLFNANTGNGMDSSWAEGRPEYAGAWPVGGPRIPGTGQLGGFTSAGGLVTFGGGNATSDGLCTMRLIFGDMVFCPGLYPPLNSLVPNQGLCFHYYGGEASVADGTFTVVWPPERIAQLQLV